MVWEYLVTFAGIVATPALTVSYVPQIVQLYKTKSSEGINTNFWVILNFALAMTTILAVDTYLTTGSIAMLVAQGINLTLALVVLGQVVYYRKKRGNLNGS